MSADGLARVEAIADDHFEGNRSAAIRSLLQLGLAAWDADARKPDQVGRRRA